MLNFFLFVVVDIELFFWVILRIIITIIRRHILVLCVLFVVWIGFDGAGWAAHFLEHLKHVVELSMKISTNFYWGFNFEEIGLTPEDALGFLNEPFD